LISFIFDLNIKVLKLSAKLVDARRGG